jgi:ferritin-like metal-binding protein YciE
MKSVKTQSQNGAGNSAKSKKTAAQSDVATGLRDLFQDSLKDIYWAEKALTKAIPKMIKKATSEELVAALTDHLEVTKNQVARVEEVFSILGVKAQAKKCAAMEGLVKEGEEIMESTEEGVVRDAGIIAASQKIEHYEIATYGTLCAFAKILNESEAADLLLETLNEEKEADDKLSEVAEGSINIAAAEEDSEEEEEEVSPAPKAKKK